QPTAVYRVDTVRLSLDEDALPCGGQALVVDGDAVWVAGSDGGLYQGAVAGGEVKPKGQPLPAPAIRLALLAKDRLAALAGQKVVIVSRKDGKVLQTLDLADPGSFLAADPSGGWLAVGTVKGAISVY